MAAGSEAWIVFSHLNTQIVGPNPPLDMDVCVRLFYLYVFLIVGEEKASD
jgi:hypothetical protein